MRYQEIIEAIKLDTAAASARSWIDKVYSRYPQQFGNNHVMPMGGSGNDQQFAMFELAPSFSRRGAVEVKWFQAYPLRQGVGSRAMQKLQQLAQEDGISLTLFPWDKGQVSQAKLTKFYRGQGFKPIQKGGKSMSWRPVTELFEPGTRGWKWQHHDDDIAVAVFTVDDVPYQFSAYRHRTSWDISFKISDTNLSKDRHGLTGTGNSAIVMGTVVDILRNFLSAHNDVTELTFTAIESSRRKLYTRMIQRLLPTWIIAVRDRGSFGGLPGTSEFTITAPRDQAIEAALPARSIESGVAEAMRAQEFITEAGDKIKIQEIQRNTASAGEKLDYSKEKLDQKTLAKIKMLPGNQQYGYTVGPGRDIEPGYQIDLIDVLAQRVVGFLGLKSAPWFPIQKSYQVSNIGIDDEYRGAGLGQSLYGIALKLLGMTIVADDTQTPEACRAWVRLSTIPGVAIQGYTSVFADDWAKRNNRNQIYDDSANRLIGALLRGGGQELGKKSAFVYVSFPVAGNVDQRELQAVQKGIAIYSARHPEDGGADNGLYARWAG